GVCYLHHCQVVHRDLHAVNILVDEDGHVAIADFGLADILDDRTESSSHSGSVRWMAPELLNPGLSPCGCFQRTSASDMYSLACIFLELFTLHALFMEVSAEAGVVMWVLKGVRPSFPSLGDCGGRVISASLWHVMESCWARLPGMRPTADTLRTRLLEL
ncbi:kinase-like protein, partial [Heliocybe sulcata]